VTKSIKTMQQIHATMWFWSLCDGGFILPGWLVGGYLKFTNVRDGVNVQN
jgi:hypothetical protein